MPNREDTPSPPEADSLAPLMAGIRGGSQSALARLMDQCWPELVRYAARQFGEVDLARDIVQEAFIPPYSRAVWKRGDVRRQVL